MRRCGGAHHKSVQTHRWRRYRWSTPSGHRARSRWSKYLSFRSSSLPARALSPLPADPPRSRVTGYSAAREARHPGETHGASHSLPQLRYVAVRAARSPLVAGSNLAAIASAASSQPQRARCGGAFLLTLSRTAPLLIHHHPNPVQVSSGVSTKAAAVQPTTSGATSCRRRLQRAGGRQVGGGGRA